MEKFPKLTLGGMMMAVVTVLLCLACFGNMGPRDSFASGLPSFIFLWLLCAGICAGFISFMDMLAMDGDVGETRQQK